MLEDNKKLFVESANSISNWRDMNITELCDKYIEYEDISPRVAEAYLSAIISRYWNVIDAYFRLFSGYISAEDIYDWLINSVLYMLKHRVWQNPKSSLYNDPNGPDKVMHIRLKSLKCNYATAQTRQTRKINQMTISLDEIAESSGDLLYKRHPELVEEFYYNYINDLVIDSFKKKDYFTAFMIDGIINAGTFNTDVVKGKNFTVFVRKKLVRHLRHIDDRYCKIFANTYKIDFEEVKKAYSYISGISCSKCNAKIIDTLFRLSRCKALK